MRGINSLSVHQKAVHHIIQNALRELHYRRCQVHRRHPVLQVLSAPARERRHEWHIPQAVLLHIQHLPTIRQSHAVPRLSPALYAGYQRIRVAPKLRVGHLSQSILLPPLFLQYSFQVFYIIPIPLHYDTGVALQRVNQHALSPRHIKPYRVPALCLVLPPPHR